MPGLELTLSINNLFAFHALTPRLFSAGHAPDDPARGPQPIRTPQRTLLAPSRMLSVNCVTGLSGLYANGGLIGARSNRDGVFEQTGAGNVMRLRLPLQRADVQSLVEFELTATQAYARFSYHGWDAGVFGALGALGGCSRVCGRYF